MGFLDDIFGKPALSEEVKKTATPFRVSLTFTPFRLNAMKEGSINLVVKIANSTNEKQLVSFEVLLPRKELLGFDPTGINKHIDKKVGEIEPGETREVAITVWATNQTRPGDYPAEVTVYSHYLNYNKVVNYIKKKTVVRVVQPTSP